MIYKYAVNLLHVLAFLVFCREVLVFMSSICNNTVKIQILTWCYAFTFVNHFNICILALLLYMVTISSHYFIFILRYLPEDNRRQPKHVRGLPHICASKYSAVYRVKFINVSPTTAHDKAKTSPNEKLILL